MPDVVKVGGAIGWAANQWVGFTLSDQVGARYAVTGNTAAYQVTCTGAGDAPQAGRAGLHYTNDAVAYFGLSGAGGAGQLIDASATWAANSWAGFAVLDVNGAEFPITGNDATTLNVTGTPASGQFWVVRGVGSANRFTLYENPLDANQVGAPNQQWRNAPHTFGANLWYLRDRTGALFAVTDTDYYATPNRMELTVAGTPASGAFELTTNPWLVSVPTVTYDNSAAGFLPPLSGTDYGSVTVTVAPEPQPGLFTLLARSGNTVTPVGDVQEIRLSARLGAGGSVLVSDWRQGP
jgi:hypothetical protein